MKVKLSKNLNFLLDTKYFGGGVVLGEDIRGGGLLGDVLTHVILLLSSIQMYLHILPRYELKVASCEIISYRDYICVGNREEMK